MNNIELLVKQNAEAIQQLIDNAKRIPETPLFDGEFQDTDLLMFYIPATDETVHITYGDLKNQLQLGAGNDKNYLHEQGTASASWTITHNLGKYPSVVTIDSSGKEIIGAVSYPDLNTVQIDFSSGFSGTATLN